MADSVTDDLTLDGGAIAEAPLRQRDFGPLVDRLCFPFELRGGQPFTLQGTVGVEAAAQADTLGVMLEFASRTIQVPIEADTSGAFEIEGTLSGESDALGEELFAEVALVDQGNAATGINLWRLVLTGKTEPDQREVCSYAAHGDRVTAVAFPSGKNTEVFASADAGGTIAVWDAQGGRRRLLLQAHSGMVRSLAITADGARLLSGGSDRSVALWDLESGEQLSRFEVHQDVVSAVRLSPDGALAATGSWDGTVKVFQTSDGSERHRLDVGDRVNAVEFSPDGAFIAAAVGRLVNPGEVRVWRVGDGEQVLSGDLADHATALAFSADSGLLAVGYGRGTIALWTTDPWAERGRLEGSSDDLVAALAFAPRDLLSATRDGKLARWSTEDMSLARLSRPAIATSAIAVSADGTLALLGGSDGLVRSIEP